jgi:hypothetical protein
MTRLDYCQFLLSSQINYTLTYFADHSADYTHDMVNRYLRQDELKPSLVWDNVKTDLVSDPKGYLLFDDTVLDKNTSFNIEAVRRQWSGNAHQVVKGIGVVTCVYVNPTTQQFWVIDFRIYNPDSDGMTKNNHVAEMLTHTLAHKHLPDGKLLEFETVLMDSWYASKRLMLHIHNANKLFYCQLKSNRLVCDQPETKQHHPMSSLVLSDAEIEKGKRVHLHDFPKDFYLSLFRLTLSTERTDYVVTNATTRPTAHDAQKACAVRWHIEQAHRELKQTTGIEKCQCRKERIQRNHIACAILVWVKLTSLAHMAKTNVYNLKQTLLDDYMKEQLRNPKLKMTLA